MGNPRSFGAWVKQRRKELDYTQERLAELIRYSVSTIRKIEAGRLRPSRQLVEQLANKLELPPEDHAVFMKAARTGSRALPETHSVSHDMAIVETVAVVPQQALARAVGGWTATSRGAALQRLSTSSTPFIGRRQELALIAERLADPTCRLLTIVGTGGIGKTRLALEAAKAQQYDFRDGVFVVWLDPINSPDLLVSAIMDALSIPHTVHAEPKAQLLDYLREKQMLLILDTFEHMLDGAELLADMLAAAQGIKLLVTSRERLKLYEEWLVPLQGLDIPDEDQVPAAAKLASAVQLFLQCAERVRPGVARTSADRPHIHRICRLVDGSPLAIELAAAWIGQRTCAEIGDEIARSLDLLVSEMRNVPERHRSIRATFEYSWHRLSTEEQCVLRRVSVFCGGFDEEATAFLCLDGDDKQRAVHAEWDRRQPSVLTVLAALVDKALLRHYDTGRYDMHELTRQYAREQLGLADEIEHAYSRHLRYFATLAASADEGLRGAKQLVWLARLEREHDNLRAALTWSQETDGNEELGLELVGSLWWFWSIRGYIHEGYRWLTAALRHAPETPSLVRARALWGAGGLARLQGDLDTAHSWLEKSVKIGRMLADSQSIAHALALLGMVALDRGEPMLACALEEESIMIFRNLPDRWGLALSLSYLALASIDMAATIEMQRSYEESLALFRELGERWGIAHTLDGLAWAANLQGNREREAELTAEMLTLCREVGDMAGVAYTLNSLGDQALCQGALAEASNHYNDGLAIFQELSNRRGIAVIHHNLGELALTQRDLAKAATEYQSSLLLFNEISDQVWLSRCLVGLASLSAAAGDAERGALLLGASDALLTAASVLGSVHDQEHYRQAAAIVAAQIDATTYTTAHAHGQAMARDQVIAFALDSTRHILSN